MNDYKGNKIEVGQTVLVVNIKSRFAGKKGTFMHFNGQESIELGTEILPDNPQWTIHNEYIIKEPGDRVFISVSDAPHEIPINMIDDCISIQPWQILCIKGVSDNQEEYLNKQLTA